MPVPPTVSPAHLSLFVARAATPQNRSTSKPILQHVLLLALEVWSSNLEFALPAIRPALPAVSSQPTAPAVTAHHPSRCCTTTNAFKGHAPIRLMQTKQPQVASHALRPAALAMPRRSA